MQLPYGKGSLLLNPPKGKDVEVLTPHRLPALEDPLTTLRAKLSRPSGTPSLTEICRDRQSVAIAVDDSTRSVPSAILLEGLLESLFSGGVEPDQIDVIVATGLHRPITTGEAEETLGAWAGKIRIESHDASDAAGLVALGTTSLGTPIRVNRTFMEADLRILTGDVEFHQFCGFGGGAKSLFPGMADAEAIRLNHSRMDWQGTGPGLLDGNPVRAEIDEAGRLAGIDFLLNVVLDLDHQIVSIHAGDLSLAFLEACVVVEKMYRLPDVGYGDLIIASPGGYPKDATLYQSQKAIATATSLVERGGRIAVLAECSEGSGSALFEQWMREAHSPEEVEKRIKNGFCMGGHKAYQIARSTRLAEVYLLSSIDPARVESWFMHPLSDINELESMVAEARRILVIPQATLTAARPGIVN